MSDALLQFNSIIYQEMMSHLALFTHPHPKKIALLNEGDVTIFPELLKHTNLIEVLHITKQSVPAQNLDHKIKSISSDLPNWGLDTNSLDVMIIAKTHEVDLFKQVFDLLHHDGILIQEASSPFEIAKLKKLQKDVSNSGFKDMQIINFPQPNYLSGWRCALMASKKVLRKPREKQIFNKSFSTHYYNFDVHKASLVLPEFMRKELELLS